MQVAPAEGTSRPALEAKEEKGKNPVVLLTSKDQEAIEAAKREKRQKKAEQRAKKQEEHYKLVLAAADATIAALRKHGISCAVFGSLACRLYGNFRQPKVRHFILSSPPLKLTPSIQPFPS
jgi:hypothetical protein